MARRTGCAACEELGVGFPRIGDRYYCPACYREKTTGVIPRGTVNTVGGGLPVTPGSERRYTGGFGSETLNRFRKGAW